VKLYEISEQHKELEKLAESSDEDMAQAIADTFEAIEGAFEDKALALVSVTNNLKSDTEALDREIKRLQARKKTIENKQDSMKEYLRMNMYACGISNIKCPLFSITLGKPRKIVLVTDLDSIPSDYVDYKMSATPMKAIILKELKSGEVIPGVELGESKPSLIIK